MNNFGREDSLIYYQSYFPDLFYIDYREPVLKYY